MITVSIFLKYNTVKRYEPL